MRPARSHPPRPEYQQKRQNDGRPERKRGKEEGVVPGDYGSERADHTSSSTYRSRKSNDCPGWPANRGREHQETCQHEEAGVAE